MTGQDQPKILRDKVKQIDPGRLSDQLLMGPFEICRNMNMKLMSVNVGQPREVEYRGKKVLSSIWKVPVSGSVAVGETNLAGDRQATAVVHGGIHKAAYAFSHDHYAWWQKELQRDDLGCGMFGENLTVIGLNEAETRVGDQWQVGSARFAVTGPRIPCSNLAMKFSDNSIPGRFSDAGWPGVYLRVLQTGSLAAGDAVELITASDGVAVRELFLAYIQPHKAGAGEILIRALNSPFLDPDMAAGIEKRLLSIKEHSQ